MGSALTSCAGGEAVRATGKRRRHHSGAHCLMPPPATLSPPSQLSKSAAASGRSQQQHLQPLKGMAPDLLPHDVSMWSSNSSRRSASAGERSGSPSPAPPSPRMRSSRLEVSDGGGSRADARALPTTAAVAAESASTSVARRFDQRALFSSTGTVAGSTAFAGQLAPSARSTVDLVRDIGDGCVPPTSNAAAAAAERQRHRGRGGDDIIPCDGSAEAPAPAYSRGSVRFRIVSQPRPAAGGAAASRLCRSASEALSVACRWQSAAASALAAVASSPGTARLGAEQCAIRPATGDFTNWTVVGKRVSRRASGHSEAEMSETAVVVRRADTHVERTSEEATDSPLPSPSSLRAAAVTSRSLSAACDDAGGCRSSTGCSLKAEECVAEAPAAAAATPSDVRQPPSEMPISLSLQPALPQLSVVDGNRTSRSGSNSGSSRTSSICDVAANLQSPPPAPSGDEPPARGSRPTILAHGLSKSVSGSGSGDGGYSGRPPAQLLNSPPSPSGSVWSSCGKPRPPPPKPPRTYSYRASMQPKRISRTTEEFVAMWDELRRSLLSSPLVDEAGSGDGKYDDDEEDSGIYMNHYAARARGWQILTLAQEALALRLDAPAAVDGLVRLGHVEAERRRALLEAATAPPRGGRDLADALIDVILEKGDTCFDAFRAFLRGNGGGSPQTGLAQLLDTLDDVLSIGVAASGRNFALTTKQCAVTCGGGGDRGDGIAIGRRWRSLIGDRAAAATAALDSGDDCRGGDCGLDDATSSGCGDGCDHDDGPTCVLDLYNERFGDASCERLAATIHALNRVSSLRLAKNGITAAGAHALSTALAAPAADGAVGRLTHLDLRLNAIGNSGLASIAAALRSAACSLEVLVLSHAGLTAGCGRLLADALLANRRFDETEPEELGAVADRAAPAAGGERRRWLRVLDLSHNEADDSDCDALADALGGGGGAPLRQLNLRGNAIGGRGCGRLCSALAGGRGGGCRLVCLDISRNRVLDDGARALAAALASPACRLRELHAEGCGVTAAGCAALCVALTTGRSASADAASPPPRSLSSLSLSNNPIADEGLRCLSEALLAAAAADDDGYDEYDYWEDDRGGAGGGLRTLRVDLCGGSPEAVGDLLRAVRLRNSSLEALGARRRTFDRCIAASCCSLRSPPPFATFGGGVCDVGRRSVIAPVDAQAQPGRSSLDGPERRRERTET